MSPQDPAMMQQMMQGGGAPAPEQEQEPSLCANCSYFRPVEEDGSIGVCQRLSEAQAGDPAWIESEESESDERPVFICTPEFVCALWEPAGAAGEASPLGPGPGAAQPPDQEALINELLSVIAA